MTITTVTSLFAAYSHSQVHSNNTSSRGLDFAAAFEIRNGKLLSVVAAAKQACYPGNGTRAQERRRGKYLVGN